MIDHELNPGPASGFSIDTDPNRLDLNFIHGYLTRSYWAAGISRDLVARAIKNSLAFGVYYYDKQVGFARVITDRSTFAYLADVFIIESYQGQGLGKWLVKSIQAHPELQGLRRFLLATRDAHGLYAQCGFQALVNPSRFMEIRDPNPYQKSS